MRVGIFLKILVPFLIALVLSSYFYLHVATEGIENSLDEILASRIEGVRQGVENEVKDLIERGEAQLQGLARVGRFYSGLEQLKQGISTNQRDLVNEAVYAKEVGDFDVLIFFKTDGWIAANGSDEREYNQPPDIYGKATGQMVWRALEGQDVRSLRYLNLEGENVILSENFAPVKYKGEIVGAIWMGWKLDQPSWRNSQRSHHRQSRYSRMMTASYSQVPMSKGHIRISNIPWVSSLSPKSSGILD